MKNKYLSDAAQYMIMAMLWIVMIAGAIMLIVYAPNWVMSVVGIAMAYYAWRRAVYCIEKAQN